MAAICMSKKQVTLQSDVGFLLPTYAWKIDSIVPYLFNVTDFGKEENLQTKEKKIFLRRQYLCLKVYT